MSRIKACAVAMLCIMAVLAPPRRYQVDGLSMAPGLQPGDVVVTGPFPAIDRLRRPRRHERWVVASPDGIPAIKRVAGMPGETVSIRDGDLSVGGRTVLTPPRILAELASSMGEAVCVSSADDPAEGCWQRIVRVPNVLDDAAFAPEERRLLLPVRDVGLAAVIDLHGSAVRDAAVRVRIRVGGVVVPWRIKERGRYGVVAGRLDGQLVGAAWPIEGDARWSADARSAFPPQVPAAWDVAQAWPDGPLSDAESSPPALAIGLSANGVPMQPGDADAMIEHVVAWRDILLRPAADGVVEWRLGPGSFFVLGDFPSGSRDSRHWGPLGRGALCSHATLQR